MILGTTLGWVVSPGWANETDPCQKGFASFSSFEDAYPGSTLKLALDGIESGIADRTLRSPGEIQLINSSALGLPDGELFRYDATRLPRYSPFALAEGHLEKVFDRIAPSLENHEKAILVANSLDEAIALTRLLKRKYPDKERRIDLMVSSKQPNPYDKIKAGEVDWVVTIPSYLSAATELKGTSLYVDLRYSSAVGHFVRRLKQALQAQEGVAKDASKLDMILMQEPGNGDAERKLKVLERLSSGKMGTLAPGAENVWEDLSQKVAKRIEVEEKDAYGNIKNRMIPAVKSASEGGGKKADFARELNDRYGKNPGLLQKDAEDEEIRKDLARALRLFPNPAFRDHLVGDLKAKLSIFSREAARQAEKEARAMVKKPARTVTEKTFEAAKTQGPVTSPADFPVAARIAQVPMTRPQFWSDKMARLGEVQVLTPESLGLGGHQFIDETRPDPHLRHVFLPDLMAAAAPMLDSHGKAVIVVGSFDEGLAVSELLRAMNPEKKVLSLIHPMKKFDGNQVIPDRIDELREHGADWVITFPQYVWDASQFSGAKFQLNLLWDGHTKTFTDTVRAGLSEGAGKEKRDFLVISNGKVPELFQEPGVVERVRVLAEDPAGRNAPLAAPASKLVAEAPEPSPEQLPVPRMHRSEVEKLTPYWSKIRTGIANQRLRPLGKIRHFRYPENLHRGAPDNARTLWHYQQRFSALLPAIQDYPKGLIMVDTPKEAHALASYLEVRHPGRPKAITILNGRPPENVTKVNRGEADWVIVTPNSAALGSKLPGMRVFVDLKDGSLATTALDYLHEVLNTGLAPTEMSPVDWITYRKTSRSEPLELITESHRRLSRPGK